MKQVKAVLVGLGGYGGQYIIFLKHYVDPETCKLVGIIDPYARAAADYDWVCRDGIPLYDDLESFYAVDQADLVIVCTPVPLHKEQVLCALSHGSHVLCEKPIVPLQQDAWELKEAAEKAGRLLGVGFQWSFSKPMLDLKQDILRGTFGRPLYMKTYTSWKRYDVYYEQGNWKGRFMDSKGNWILDSVATNATSHYLSNLFFLMGDRLDHSRMPQTATAGIYRVKDIESFDTCFLRGRFDNGCVFYYGATHSGETEHEPILELKFEQGMVTMSDKQENRLVAHLLDGREIDYGVARSQEISASKVTGMIEAIRGRGMVTSPIESVMPHLKVTNAIFDQVTIASMPKGLCFREENPSGTFMKGLDRQCLACYEDGLMPSEEGYSWAVPETELNLENYNCFSGERYKR